MMTHETATAHQAWDQRWQSESGRADWLTPDAGVLAAIDELHTRSAQTALDLGCGVGRHTLALARAGFTTYAFDGSAAGIDYLRTAAETAGLTIEARVGQMTRLPYSDAQFDYVLAFNVIYHGDATIVRRVLDEIRRVLKPGGLYQGTMLSKRNAKYGVGSEIAPNTFVIDNDGDKDHPHFYCNARELLELYDGFELLSLTDKLHEKPGSWHWHLLAERAT
jgi:SAM-dependent methyltransferase